MITRDYHADRRGVDGAKHAQAGHMIIALKWTTKKPASPGWYWWRNLSKCQGPILVEVWNDEQGHLKSGPPAYFVEGNIDTSEEWAEREWHDSSNPPDN